MADEFKGDTYTKVTRQVFGDGATRLEAEGQRALAAGRLSDASRLGFQSMAAGAVHLADQVGTKTKALVNDGEGAVAGIGARWLKFSRRAGEKINGPEAVRLQDESTRAFREGKLGTSAELLLQSAGAGAAHLADLVGTTTKGLVSGGEAVSTNGVPPATPVSQAPDQPAR